MASSQPALRTRRTARLFPATVSLNLARHFWVRYSDPHGHHGSALVRAAPPSLPQRGLLRAGILAAESVRALAHPTAAARKEMTSSKPSPSTSSGRVDPDSGRNEFGTRVQ